MTQRIQTDIDDIFVGLHTVLEMRHLVEDILHLLEVVLEQQLDLIVLTDLAGVPLKQMDTIGTQESTTAARKKLQKKQTPRRLSSSSTSGPCPAQQQV